MFTVDLNLALCLRIPFAFDTWSVQFVKRNQTTCTTQNTRLFVYQYEIELRNIIQHSTFVWYKLFVSLPLQMRYRVVWKPNAYLHWNLIQYGMENKNRIKFLLQQTKHQMVLRVGHPILGIQFMRIEEISSGTICSECCNAIYRIPTKVWKS